MGKVISIKKWDLNNNSWKNIVNDEDKKRALSIATYGTIRHTESDDINYIILADGCRVENHTKNASHIGNNHAGISNIISYFENKKENYKIELLLVDNDAPLIEESKFLASYVDYLARFSTTKTINVIGLSKCGVIAFDMMKYLKSQFSKMKARVYSVSSPYMGTVMASPLFLERKVRTIIEAKIGKTFLVDNITKALMDLYYSIMSNSHMDLDIAIPGEIPEHLMSNYDSSFLQNIFSNSNISSISNVKHYQNICTVIDDTTLKNALKSGNFAAIGLCILNDVLFDGKSDGMVSLDSQKRIEDFYSDEHSASKIITTSHGALSIPIYANELLDIVNSNMLDDTKLQRTR